MSTADDDLIRMFRDEARDRLERVADLVQDMARDPEATVSARRELHALKGASRMLGLSDLDEMCHVGEELLVAGTEDDLLNLTALLDRLVGEVEALSSIEVSSIPDAIPDEEETGPPAFEKDTSPDRSSPHHFIETMRVRPEVLDRMTDRGARLRVISTAAAGLVDRVFRLVLLAEQGSRGRVPQQVLATLANSLRQLAVELEAGQRRVQRLAEGLLDALLKLQIQPLRPVLLSLARHARELARSLDREVRVEVAAADTHLDRRIVRAVEEALLHVVRNAVDHGIETPDARASAGKPRRGVIRLAATAESDRIRIVVSDDGRGIDPRQILNTAVRRGEITEQAAHDLSPEESLQFLLRPGFSTRERPSKTSGRGIGLDAVSAAIQAVGGDLKIESIPGSGTTVRVEVPATRRGERVLVVEVGGGLVALPSAGVRSFRVLDQSTLRCGKDQHPGTTPSDPQRVRYLGDVLGKPRPDGGTVIETVVGGVTVALIVDAVVGEEEVFLRPLPERAGAPRVFDSMTLLARGRPVAVLSPHRLGTLGVAGDMLNATSSRSVPIRVLLVDDSRVTREMIRRLLADAGFAVTTVPSAREALHEVATSEFDCVVTDIEMPEMDGLELTRRLRKQTESGDIPVIVVSTRDRPADRRAGLEAGADGYLYKQDLDASELVALVQRLGGGA